jgi:ADP-heptose:LPS heptosyltransferase/GT2 family glycosyltransferase
MTFKTSIVDIDPNLRASIVIASYKNPELTKRCVESIIKVEPNRRGYEIIIVDDCSGAADKFNLETYCKARSLKYVYRSVNGGYATAAATGMYYSKGRITILINNDMEMITPFLSTLEEDFKHDPRIAIIGCKLLYPNEKIQHAGVAWIGGTLDFVHQYHNLSRTDFRVQEKRYCISVTGAFYAIDTVKMNRLGVLNDDYFIAYDDTEYSLNAWSRGFRILYEPNIEAYHLEGFTRGATKEQKAKKGTWNKEQETREYFVKNVLSYNIAYIKGLVDESNAFSVAKEKAKKEIKEAEINTAPVVEIKKPGHHDDLSKVMSMVGKKIVIKRQGAIGDVILTTPIARHLKIAFPESKIIVATDVGFIYKNNPNVDVVVPHNRIPTNVDVVYDLDLCYERMPKMHIIDAYALKVFGHSKIDKRIELFPEASDYEFIKSFMHANSLIHDKTVVVHMGVSWQNRTWPIEKWNQVVAALSSKWKVIIVGKAGRDYGIKSAGNIVLAHDQFSFLQLKCLMDHTSCFIGIDSSLLHVAGCTDIPIVPIFTATNPDYRVPFRGGVLGKGVFPVIPSVECRGCLHEEAPPVTFSSCRRNDLICMTQVTPNAVLNAVKSAVGVP